MVPTLNLDRFSGCRSRQIVGWAMDKHMEAKLSLDALAMAYWRRKPPKGLLHHSDRGSQYACHEYQKQLQHYGMIASMCRRGDCWEALFWQLEIRASGILPL